MYHTTSCPWSFRNTSGEKFQNKKIKFENKNIFLTAHEFPQKMYANLVQPFGQLYNS